MEGRKLGNRGVWAFRVRAKEREGEQERNDDAFLVNFPFILEGHQVRLTCSWFRRRVAHIQREGMGIIKIQRIYI